LPEPEITPGSKIAGAGRTGSAGAVVVILLARLDTSDWANDVVVSTEIAARKNALWVMNFPGTDLDSRTVKKN
jgi:hypothetical protein